MARIINRVGEVYSGLKIIEELGNNEVKAQCLEHGHIGVYSKSNLVNGSIKYCKKCKEESDLKEGDIKGDYKVVKVTEDKVAIVCIKCGDKRVRSKNSFKYTDEPKCKLCSNTGRFKNTTGEVFGKLKVVRDRGGGVVKAKCEECGAIGEYNKGRLTNQGYKCICCEKKNSGINDNQVGKVFNGCYVLEETTKEDNKVYLKIECVDCGKVKEVLKGAAITYAIACRACYHQDKSGVCPKCKQELKFKRAANRCKCPSCGENMSRSIISSAIDFQYRLYKNSKIYGVDSDRVIGNMHILKYKYRGRDILSYFDAVCLDHNKKVVVNINEAKTNSHTICECDYEM